MPNNLNFLTNELKKKLQKNKMKDLDNGILLNIQFPKPVPPDIVKNEPFRGCLLSESIINLPGYKEKIKFYRNRWKPGVLIFQPNKDKILKFIHASGSYVTKFTRNAQSYTTALNPVGYLQPLAKTEVTRRPLFGTGDLETLVLKVGDFDEDFIFNENDENSILNQKTNNTSILTRDVLKNIQTNSKLTTFFNKNISRKIQQSIVPNLENPPLAKPIQKIRRFDPKKISEGMKEASDVKSDKNSKLLESTLSEEEGDDFFNQLHESINNESPEKASLVPCVSTVFFGNIKKTYALNQEDLIPYNKTTLIQAGDNIVCSCIHDCINYAVINDKEYIQPVYIYYHNFAHFDGFFVLKAFYRNIAAFELYIKQFEKANPNKQAIEAMIVDNGILSFRVGQVIFRDSYKLAPYSLQNLSTNLINEGKTLNITTIDSAYKNMIKILVEEPSRAEFLNYCLNDSIILYKCLEKIIDSFQIGLNCDVTQSLTAPALGLKLFKESYYGSTRYKTEKIDKTSTLIGFSKQPIITEISNRFNVFGEEKLFVHLVESKGTLITENNQAEAIFLTDPQHEANLRNAFYGGRTELINPIVGRGKKPILELDINSLYPKAAAGMLPYGPPRYESIPTGVNFDLKSFFGFAHIEWISPASLRLFPVLPTRINNAYTSYHLGFNAGWYSSLEIQLAVKMGYKIKILEVLRFEKKPGMRKIVKDFYKLRQTYPKNHPLNLLTKLILNSLCYGKFAIHTDLKRLFIVNKDKALVPSITNQYDIKQQAPIPNSNFNIVTGKEKTNDDNLKSLADIFSTDLKTIKKLYTNNLELSSHQRSIYKHLNSAVHISAMVTAQSRVLMYPFLADAFKENHLYYSDTDSIFVTRDFFMNKYSKTVNPQKLGFFKLEGEFVDGLFVDLKRYKLFSNNPNMPVKVKFKGVPEQYIKQGLLNNIDKTAKSTAELETNFTVNQSLKRHTSLLTMEQLNNKNITITNKNIKNYRDIVIDNKTGEWVATRTKILNKNGEPITLTKLKQKYNSFISNIEDSSFQKRMLWLKKLGYL